METTIHTENYRGHTIEIHQDIDAASPDELWADDNLFLVHYHRNFWQTNDKIVTQDELAEYYHNDEPPTVSADYWIFWLTAHIHSGVWLYLGNLAQAPFDSGGWDTSHCGAVLVAKSEWPGQDKAHKAAEGLVSEWNDYLSGNVYGYIIDGDLCDDSCWGFYGDYEKYCLPEAKGAVDYAIKEARQEHFKKLKQWIKSGVNLQYRTSLPNN